MSTEATPEPSQRITEVDADGWVIDSETGEVVGREDVLPAVVVENDREANVLLELRCRTEANIAAIDYRLDVLRDNLRRQRKQQENRLAFWDWRYGPAVIAYAKKMLARGKARTLTFDWGRVKVRRDQGAHKIVDHDEALDFVKQWSPGLVKTREHVGVTEVLSAREVAARECAMAEENMILPFMTAEPPGDRWEVVTGILKQTGRNRGREGNGDGFVND